MFLLAFCSRCFFFVVLLRGGKKEEKTNASGRVDGGLVLGEDGGDGLELFLDDGEVELVPVGSDARGHFGGWCCSWCCLLWLGLEVDDEE